MAAMFFSGFGRLKISWWLINNDGPPKLHPPEVTSKGGIKANVRKVVRGWSCWSLVHAVGASNTTPFEKV